MVAKISHGTSLYGALAYNCDKVTAGTAEILSGNRMISDRLGLPSEDIRLALLSFENYLLANRNTEKPVLHISLSVHTDTDDMNVGIMGIGMFVGYVRLIPIAHLLHIPFRQLYQ